MIMDFFKVVQTLVHKCAATLLHEILILRLRLVSLALLSVLSVTFGWQQVICSVALDGD